MNILITRDMPLLELYQGDTLPIPPDYLNDPDKLLFFGPTGILNGKTFLFPVTCAELDYTRQVIETQNRLQLTDDIIKLMNETEDDTKNLEI